eukprot:SAG22_NODE_9374_length_592_cov_1.760649_1_plen_118_part_01
MPAPAADATVDPRNPHGVEGWVLQLTAQCAYNAAPAVTVGAGGHVSVREFAIRQNFGESAGDGPRRFGESAAAYMYASRLTDPRDLLCLCSLPSAAYVNATAVQRGWANWTTAFEQRF